MNEDVLLSMWEELKHELFLYRSKLIEGTPHHFGLILYRNQMTGEYVTTYCLNIDEDQLDFEDDNIIASISKAIATVKQRNKGAK